MNTMLVLLNMLLIYIILVLVQVGLLQKKNSAFGHVQVEDEIIALC